MACLLNLINKSGGGERKVLTDLLKKTEGSMHKCGRRKVGTVRTWWLEGKEATLQQVPTVAVISLHGAELACFGQGCYGISVPIRCEQI